MADLRLAVSELHPPVETLCQWHRQRSRLRPGRSVCQRHLRRGQQDICECNITVLYVILRCVLVALSFFLCVRQAEDMVTGIKGAFQENLKRVRWMDDETKTAAKQKVWSSRMFVHTVYQPTSAQHLWKTPTGRLCSTVPPSAKTNDLSSLSGRRYL